VAKNTVDRPNWEVIRETWKEAKGDLQAVFVKLNWGHPALRPFSVQFGETDSIEVKPISHLRNFHAFEIEFPTNTPNALIRQIQKEIAKTHPDNVLIVKDANHVRFEWPRRKPDGGIKYDTFTTGVAIPNQLACQKLAGVGFGVLESGSISLEDVRSRVYGLASEDVTKKFYVQFRKEHKNIAKAIQANEELSDSERQSYSSLLLNRLMFVYFLQKKEFLDGDTNRLRNGLQRCEEASLNFYREALLPLFFEGFNGQNQKFTSPQLDELWGKIPYINGGIFAEHGLEASTKLDIPNSAFAELFEFFESFNWHLDARPLGSSNEINPEVLGYIFEQYINETADGKKEGGSYYTPEDVTGYMVAQTLIPRVLDEFVKVWPGALTLVSENVEDYLHLALLHGRAVETPDAWIEAPADLLQVWNDDPIGWTVLDEAERLDDICLPGETWVETFYRRERVDKLISHLRLHGVAEVNDLITHNLNGARLVSDIIAQASNPKDLVSAWNVVTELAVIDPTCGSGAFLFAALTSLESIYEDILDALGENRKMVGAQFVDGNLKYKVRKHVAMRNLYGTDIMTDAIETAKLRIFLSLAAVLENASEIEPLPDLDFNLKVGNLVIGLVNEQDTSRLSPNNELDFFDFSEVGPEIHKFDAAFREFKRAEIENISDLTRIKSELLSIQQRLRTKINLLYQEASELAVSDSVAQVSWVNRMHPFHWFAEFPQVMTRGGFDVVIGNPPYISMSKIKREDPEFFREVRGYHTAKCPDFYAVCYERSVQLTSGSGRHGFVVMLNISFSDDYAPLRKLLRGKFSSEWWSTYDLWPQGLFNGPGVRNTILILANGGGKVYSTHHQIFSSSQRKWLFSALEYFAQKRRDERPPIRAGLATHFAELIDSSPIPSAEDLHDSRIHWKSVSNYWIPVTPIRPPILSLDGRPIDQFDNAVKPLKLEDGEPEPVALAVLSGKIGFMWWQSIGDGFHVTSAWIKHPRALLRSIWDDETVIQQAKSVEEAGYSNLVANKNRSYIYTTVRWAGIRQITDHFDRLVTILAAGKDAWRSLNIHYRQTMRSNDSRQAKQDSAGLEKIWRDAARSIKQD
jgi:type I restriction-modification system DNA methylase subunit